MFPKRECGSKRVKPQVSLRKMQVHPYRSMPPALPKPSMVPSAERKRTTSLPSLRTPSSACAGACRSPMFREHRYLCPPARTQHRCIFVCFSSCQGGTHEQHLCLPAPCHNRCNFVCFFFLPGAWTSSTSRGLREMPSRSSKRDHCALPRPTSTSPARASSTHGKSGCLPPLTALFLTLHPPLEPDHLVSRPPPHLLSRVVFFLFFSGPLWHRERGFRAVVGCESADTRAVRRI